MSREIKFRAWSKKRKSYRELDQLVFDNQGLEEIWVVPKDNETQQVYNPSEMIIEQFTGLKEKNGKEIYEGDILDSPQGRCLCVWSDDGWAYQFKVHRTDWFDIVKDWHEQSEVIGNIHENPELLGGEE